jgi:hypothetical protein
MLCEEFDALEFVLIARLQRVRCTVELLGQRTKCNTCMKENSKLVISEEPRLRTSQTFDNIQFAQAYRDNQWFISDDSQHKRSSYSVSSCFSTDQDSIAILPQTTPLYRYKADCEIADRDFVDV